MKLVLKKHMHLEKGYLRPFRVYSEEITVFFEQDVLSLIGELFGRDPESALSEKSARKKVASELRTSSQTLYVPAILGPYKIGVFHTSFNQPLYAAYQLLFLISVCSMRMHVYIRWLQKF
uniref:BEACH-type PH domain-containing protein n=1 Tax=Heterorhabditis bacteriophora TaxID=37862 RepID=A0A1I7XTC5_HETBA